MLKVSVTAYDSPVTIQDPRPGTQHSLEQAVVSVQPNTTRELLMQWGQLERISSQLDALAAADLIKFNINSAGVSVYAEQTESYDNPIIDYVSDGIVTAASQALDISGTKLTGEQSIATATIAGDTALGSVLVESVNPGHGSNLYDIEVVDSASGGLAVSTALVEGRTVISVDLGGSAAETCTTVAAIINNAASDTYGLVHATVVDTGSTAIATVKELQAFTGGTGTGMSITLAGMACTVVSINSTNAPIYTITVATPDLSSLALATSAPLMLQVRANDKVSYITLTHA